MNHEEWLAPAEIYALGALDGDERTVFEAHLAAGCLTCERHILMTCEALTLLPRSLPPVAPPASVRERLLEQITTEATAPTPLKRVPGQRRW